MARLSLSLFTPSSLRRLACDMLPKGGRIFFCFVAVLAMTGAISAESSLAPSPSHDAPPGWNRANLVLGAWGLLTIAALLGISRWRALRRRPQSEPKESQKLSSTPENSTPPEEELDLQLLRYLSDGTAGGLSEQIDVYLAAFDSDRRAARLVFAEGDQKKIHRIAHRLVSHAGAVRCVPLVNLATAVQAGAAMLTPQQLDQAISEIDREFARLRSRLDALRASTGPG